MCYTSGISYILESIVLDIHGAITIVQIDTCTTISESVVFYTSCTECTTNTHKVRFVLCTSAKCVVLNFKVMITVLPLIILSICTACIMTKLYYTILGVLCHCGSSHDIVQKLKSRNGLAVASIPFVHLTISC